jgi:predicted RNA-binding Zn-ribbon protein involved in translation (DUF1610 family)
MRRQKVDPKAFDLTCPCPGCGYKIPPAEILRVDGENIRCPKCGLDFLYITRKPQTTS